MKLKNPYTFFDQFCLRTPILPLDFYYDLTREQNITIATFKDVWKNDNIREAIFLASPELFSEIEKWLSGQLKDVKKSKRLESSLLKYLSRMSSRCTPFGLFAGCSIGTFGKATAIELANYDKHQRQTRFDMNFLVAFSQKLAKEEAIKKQLLWYTNNSLYKIGDQYRYIEYKYNQYNRREHSIEAVAYAEYLEAIIESARSGKKIKELASLLVDDEITYEEASEFISELIDNQILVSEIEPSVTGDDFLEQLEDCLSQIEGADAILTEIQHYKKFLEQVDQKLGNETVEYLRLSERIAQLETPFELKYLFQADMYTQAQSNQLNIRWGYKLTRALELLNRISSASSETHLQRFKDAFVKRYETQEIPLATVLDTEVGIGYLQHQDANDSTSFLDDLYIPSKPVSGQEMQWTAVQEILNKKLQDIHKENQYTLLLEDKDFEHLELDWSDLPDTMSTIVQIATIDGEEKMIFSSIGGSSAANLLGRFSTGNKNILKHVQDIAAVEQEMYQNQILAEVVHLPESRTGNVIRRATIRDYEIPYLGKSNVPIEQQVAISDLMISVQYGRIVLRSKTLNKEIIPRLTNAHNYSANALPVYHFLCDMQKQGGRSGLGFYWGEVLEKHTFLPRVVYKEFIIEKARWDITTADLPFLKENNEKDKMEMIVAWRAKHNIPVMVQLIDGDNTLLINLENVNSVNMWLDTIKNKKRCRLEEFLFAEEVQSNEQKGIVQQEGMSYTNQFIISMFNKEKLEQERKKTEASKAVEV
ncbi:lantibiotic biosynthesis dehydratase-like protein [Aquimarina sp. MAR_2010_214]|uniref:lantibiotic dehydratase family protein n=1 Tax=Aquimarina sp. MAR_2010_214 TaxID=1250026 RepID=UPI000C70DB09|nr:lantibiotic dehydratase family protein [Aquimarina sp. MAR_2010_214]PKV48449.1 lantibiotic biosynthesis dehydratase-like protein [Aquimarina sp. MAR_2010_214]